jgi:hypothetical protein
MPRCAAAIRIALAALLVCVACTARAQSRFALGVDTGADVPLSSQVQNAALLPGATSEEGGATGLPLTVDRLARPGFHIGISAHVSILELRYRYERFAWRGARTACVGDRDAVRRPDGEIEDADVEYDCAVGGERITVPGESAAALNLHHLGIGPRFSTAIIPRARMRGGEIVERQRARVFGVFSAGPTIASYVDPNFGRVARFGAHAAAGGGTEIPLDRRLWLVFDVRYSVSLVASASPPSSRSTRVAAADRSVLAAIFDSGHRLAASVGIRFDFR